MTYQYIGALRGPSEASNITSAPVHWRRLAQRLRSTVLIGPPTHSNLYSPYFIESISSVRLEIKSHEIFGPNLSTRSQNPK